MRTTLNIDDDVLAAVKEIAGRESRSAGEVASDMIRKSLTTPDAGVESESADRFEALFGFRPLPKRGVIVTNEIVNQLRDELDI